MFDASFFTENRTRFKEKTHVHVALFAANGLVQKSADTTFPFRQDSNFWYLTGCNVPDALLVLDIKNSDSFIIMPKRSSHRDQWEGALDNESIKSASGIANIYTYEEGWSRLKQILSRSTKVGVILPHRSYEPAYGMYINPAKVSLSRRIKREYKGDIVDIRTELAALRQIKHPIEIAALTKAADITVTSLNNLKKQLQSMNNEREISVFLTHSFATMGADGHGYDPIIASAGNASTIHYDKNNAPLEPHSFVLLDVGAQYGMYSADVSRTWAIGEMSKRHGSVFKAVTRVHAYALSLIKPGITLREYEKQVRSCMKKELKALGLITDDDTKNHLLYYPHLTSHFLGIDVHDAGNYDTPLAENMVITVEPGIYIANENIGVRIEDDVLVTKNGYKNLTAACDAYLL